MRSKLMILSILTFSALSHAGVPDFNSVLAENEKIQKELTLKLQKQLETKDLGKTEKPDFHKVGAEIVGRGSENVAVETSETTERIERNKSLEVEKKSFRRLSQEIKDATR